MRTWDQRDLSKLMMVFSRDIWLIKHLFMTSIIYVKYLVKLSTDGKLELIKRMKKFIGILIVIFLTACAPLSQQLKEAIRDMADESQVASSSSIQLPGSASTPHTLNTVTPTYRTITWKELYTFVTDDPTNLNQYIPGKYECVNFALDLTANAHKQNINAWIVTVDFGPSQTGHAFVAFPTTDKGIVYIEPQTDDVYKTIEVGKLLCLMDDSNICGTSWGKVTAIHQQVQCDAATRQCWVLIR